METETKGGIKKMVIEAVVIRKDGTVENLGQISYWHKNPLCRLWNTIKTTCKYCFDMLK